MSQGYVTLRFVLVGLVVAFVGAAEARAATFIVDSTGDLGDAALPDDVCGTATGECTLRAAIQQANWTLSQPGQPNEIHFGIAGTGPFTISLGSPLPTVDRAILINGYTQAGAAPATPTSPAILQIEIAGNGMRGVSGLHLRSNGCAVRGLSIFGFEDDWDAFNNVPIPGYAIRIDNAGASSVPEADIISGNWLGIAPSGNPQPTDRGVGLTQSWGHTIGGAAAAERNVIGGTLVGVDVVLNSSDIEITGNLIGLRPDGATASGSATGIQVTNSAFVLVQDNVISANATAGVSVFATASVPTNDVYVFGNRIGTDAAGTTGLGNGTGVLIGGDDYGSVFNIFIGGTAAGDGNVIAANSSAGIALDAPYDGVVQYVSIEGNLIGTDASGLAALGNETGIVVTGDFASAIDNVRIGGPGSAGNTISGNTYEGTTITMEFSTTFTAIDVLGNRFGLGVDGVTQLPNTVGIHVEDWDSTLNQIRIGRDGAANRVAANSWVGIYVEGADAGGIVIDSNVVGLDQAGLPVGNGVRDCGGTCGDADFNGDGIAVTAASGAVICANVVGGHQGRGIVRYWVDPGDGLVYPAIDSAIDGNRVGLDPATQGDAGNVGAGIVAAVATMAAGSTVNVECGGSSHSLYWGGITSNQVANNGVGMSVSGDSLFVASNEVSANDGPGIQLAADSVRVTLSENVFGGNAGNAIDLDADGITVNSGVDPDFCGFGTGANAGIDVPTIIEVAPASATSVRVSGTACALAEVEIFVATAGAGDSLAGDDFGEGIVLAGSTSADAAGSFSVSLPLGAGVTLAAMYTATATDADGNSSEFGSNVVSEAPGPGEVVINEVDYDQPGADDQALEFIELYNASLRRVDLSFAFFELYDGSLPGLYRTVTLTDYTGTQDLHLAAGDYFVVCALGAAVPNCDLGVPPGTDLLQDGAADAIALMVGVAGDWGYAVDTVSYDGDAGGSYVETSGAPDDDPGQAGLGISRIPDGQDTDDNSVDFSVRCVTPGEANGSTATACRCGDSVQDAGEGCDDGNRVLELCAYGETSCLVCDTTCQSVLGATRYCGDSSVDAADGEGCDDGNAVTEDCAYGESSCTVCDATCQSVAGATSFCGDGSVDSVNGEVCDDGNTVTEACDYGAGGCTVCDATCQSVSGATRFCGDGTVDNGEACDDGNAISADGCSAACEIEEEPAGGTNGSGTDGGGADGGCNCSGTPSNGLWLALVGVMMLRRARPR